MAKHREEAKQARDKIIRNLHSAAVAGYEHGEEAISKQQHERAAAAFQRAHNGFLEVAKLGYAPAAAHLGLMYSNNYVPNSTDAEYNESRAAIWFARAIKMGDETPISALAEMMGVDIDPSASTETTTAQIMAAMEENGFTPEDLSTNPSAPGYFDAAEQTSMVHPLGDGAGAAPAGPAHYAPAAAHPDHHAHAAAAAGPAPAHIVPTVQPGQHGGSGPAHLAPAPHDLMGHHLHDHGAPDCG